MGLLLICEISVVGHRVRTTEEDRHRPGLATATDLAPGATRHVSIEAQLFSTSVPLLFQFYNQYSPPSGLQEYFR